MPLIHCDNSESSHPAISMIREPVSSPLQSTLAAHGDFGQMLFSRFYWQNSQYYWH